MFRALILGSVIVGSLAFAADKMKEEKSETTTTTTTTAKAPDRQVASTSSSALAQKSYELASLMVQALGKDTANCELNIYDTQAYSQVEMSRGLDESVPVPSNVAQYFARNVGYRGMMSKADWRSKPADLTKIVAGSRMYVRAMTRMLAGTIDFNSDGTYVMQQGSWDNEKETFVYNDVKGTWKIMAPKQGDYKGLALILQKNGARIAKSYRLGWVGSELGFIKGNRAKDTSNYEYLDMAFAANDGGGCGD